MWFVELTAAIATAIATAIAIAVESATHPNPRFALPTARYSIPTHAQTLPSAYLRAGLPMHLKLRGGGGGDGLAPYTLAKSAATRAPRRQRTHNNFPTPSFSSEQAPTRLQADGAFVSQVQSSVTSTCRYPEVSAGDEDGIRSAVTGPTAADADAAGADDAKPPGLPSPPRTGGQGSSGSAERSPETQGKASGEDSGFGGGRGRGGGTSSNAPVSWLAGEDRGSSAAGAGWESAWDMERESRGLTGHAGSRFPGSSARQDMPSGLKECVERMCAAAFLRGHVPKGLMPKGTTPAEAYQRWGRSSHTRSGYLTSPDEGTGLAWCDELFAHSLIMSCRLHVV